ncbi:hypothetical protein ABZY93_22275 [Streptomyces smyrnaeus]|uniref:hypothetical protein n=1 Tax=Streptomyces smyrnaeus TaxID=1387713 RepID=UPI0033BA46FC
MSESGTEMITVHLYFTDGSRESEGQFPAVPRKGDQLKLSRVVRNWLGDEAVAAYEYEVTAVEWSGSENGKYAPYLTLREVAW